MSKSTITYKDIVEKLYTYREERGWLNLDSADLAKSIVLESAELLEHYQWDNTRHSRGDKILEKNKPEIATEVADIFIYLLEFCQDNNIDLLETTHKKIKHNDKKFPADKMRIGGQRAYDHAKKKYREKHK